MTAISTSPMTVGTFLKSLVTKEDKDMKLLYPTVHELANSNDVDFIKSSPCNWMFGFGEIPSYVELNAKWEDLFYKGLLSESEYNSNPFPL